jgi:hypothetical protein
MKRLILIRLVVTFVLAGWLLSVKNVPGNRRRTKTDEFERRAGRRVLEPRFRRLCQASPCRSSVARSDLLLHEPYHCVSSSKLFHPQEKRYLCPRLSLFVRELTVGHSRFPSIASFQLPTISHQGHVTQYSRHLGLWRVRPLILSAAKGEKDKWSRTLEAVAQRSWVLSPFVFAHLSGFPFLSHTGPWFLLPSRNTLSASTNLVTSYAAVATGTSDPHGRCAPNAVRAVYCFNGADFCNADQTSSILSPSLLLGVRCKESSLTNYSSRS